MTVAQLRKRLDHLHAFDDTYITPCPIARKRVDVKIMSELDAADQLGLVRAVAYKHLFTNESLEDSDAYQDGVLGLLKAIETYDSSKGFAFSTWAYPIIRSAIVEEYRKRQRQVKIPETSLDQLPARAMRGTLTRDEVLEHSKQEAPFPPNLLKRFLEPHPDDSECDRIDRDVMVRHYLRQETLKSIGEDLGVTRERARQRCERAITRVKSRFSSIIQDVLDATDE